VLYMHLTSDMQHRINIDSDAKLILNNCVIKSNNSAYHYRIYVGGELYIKNSTLYDVGASGLSAIYSNHGLVHIDGLSIYNGSYRLIYLYNSDNSTVKNVKFYTISAYGIFSYSSDNITVSNIFYNGTSYGIYSRYTYNSEFTNITTRYAKYGFYSMDCGNLTITDLKSYDTNTTSVDISKSKNIVLSNVIANSWGSRGINLYQDENVTVSNINLANGKQYGINLSSTNNSIIDHATLTNTGTYGIYFQNAHNISMSNIEIHDIRYGIYVTSSNVNITGVTANNSTNAITNSYSYLVIDGLNTEYCNKSLYQKSPYPTILRNSHFNNIREIPIVFLSGSYAIFNNFTIENSFVNGHPIVYIKNKISQDITGDIGMLILFNVTNSLVHDLNIDSGLLTIYYSNDVHFENLKISNSPFAIYLASSTNLYVNDALLYNSIYGIGVGFCTNVSVSNVRAYNDKFGLFGILVDTINITDSFFLINENAVGLFGISKLYMYHTVLAENIKALGIYSTNGRITESVFAYNTEAIYGTSNSANISLNTFIENVRHTNLNTSTIDWTNGTHGNYWSDYTGLDLDHNGIGDTAYTIQTGESDDKPLMKPMDQIPPVLVSNISSPAEPTSSQEVSVTVSATDQSRVHTIILSYYNGTTWINVTMAFVIANETWIATIPALPSGTNVTVVYYIQDFSGNWAKVTGFSYVVKSGGIIASIDPMLLIIGAVAVVVVVGGIIVIKKRKK